jgi:hypothetical protein
VADERLTLRQAAARLGVSESAIRKRVERGSLRSDKGPDGRRYVYLDPGASASFAVADEGADEGADTSATGERGALISQLKDEVAYLRDENRRKDEIIMQQAMTMRQLTATPSQEATDAREAPDRAEARSDTGGASEATDTQRPPGRSWWRRWFG